MGLDPVVDPAFAPTNILLVRDRFQMIWIDAAPYAAKMIQAQTVRYRPLQGFIHLSMASVAVAYFVTGP